MVNFTENNIVPAFLGGLIICLATSLNLYLKGRMTNVTNTIHGVITLEKPRLAWKSCTLAGLIFAGALSFHLYGFGYIGEMYLFDLPLVFINGLDYAGWILGALLIGFGARLSNGDTSAHAFCGVPRCARRAIVATVVFLFTGCLLANLRFNYPFFYDTVWAGTTSSADVGTSANIAIGLCALILVFSFITNDYGSDGAMDVLISFLLGFLYGVGLIVAGVCKRNKILSFLTFDDQWDPSYLFVLVAVIVGNWLTFNCIFARGQPTQGSRFEVPNSVVIDVKLILGAALFGAGWGITGLCPGPALVVAPLYIPQIIALFLPCVAFGQVLADKAIESWDRRGFESFD
jgi:uncharacterized membrane protein YedE/YeeE